MNYPRKLIMNISNNIFGLQLVVYIKLKPLLAIYYGHKSIHTSKDQHLHINIQLIIFLKELILLQ